MPRFVSPHIDGLRGCNSEHGWLCSSDEVGGDALEGEISEKGSPSGVTGGDPGEVDDQVDNTENKGA